MNIKSLRSDLLLQIPRDLLIKVFQNLVLMLVVQNLRVLLLLLHDLPLLQLHKVHLLVLKVREETVDLQLAALLLLPGLLLIELLTVRDALVVAVVQTAVYYAVYALQNPVVEAVVDVPHEQRVPTSMAVVVIALVVLHVGELLLDLQLLQLLVVLAYPVQDQVLLLGQFVLAELRFAHYTLLLLDTVVA